MMWYVLQIIGVLSYILTVFQNYYCAYVGAFGEFSCNPRTLGSSHLNRMISLEGIVTKCSLVRPKVIQSVHYSERKDRFLARKYRDQTMTASGATSLNVYPQEDDEKNPVSEGVFLVLLWSLIRAPAYHRVRLLYVYGPSNDINSRNAGKSTCRTAAEEC